MKYKDSNITFNNVKDISKGAGIPTNMRFAGGRYEYDDDDNPVSPKFLINAIDIDWNEADFANASAPSSEPTTINTSGDLIKAIKWASTLGSGSGGGHGQMGVTGAQGIHGISS